MQDKRKVNTCLCVQIKKSMDVCRTGRLNKAYVGLKKGQTRTPKQILPEGGTEFGKKQNQIGGLRSPSGNEGLCVEQEGLCIG